MEAFANVCFLLATVLLCSSFTEGAINSWQVNTATVITATDTPIDVTVAETSVVTTVLFTLTATVDTGALASYSIETQPNAGQFKIGDVGTADVGKVQLETTKVLDYETDTSIVIEVIAVDDTGTPLTGTATVTITITDVTTYTPVFTTPSSTSVTCVAIPDLSAANTVVYTVVAANAATNGITYSFGGTGNTASDFTITGGAITVANALAKTRTALYGLAVLGIDADTDTATETGTALIAVTVGGTCPSTSGAGTVATSVITIMSGILLSLFKLV